jgi:hypothetical protein
MPWQDILKADPIPWLLEDQDPGVRYLALRDLCDLAGDAPELIAARALAHSQGPIAQVLDAMHPEGFWEKPGPGYSVKYRSTVWSVILLAQLGGSIAADERIARACGYLLDYSLMSMGQFSSSGAPSGTIDCLQGNLCWALTVLGCDDPRLDAAYAWLAHSQTGEGIAPREDQSALVRYYAYKCGPGFACGVNYRQPCAWGAVKVMLALAARKSGGVSTPAMEQTIRLGVDFLFGVDPASAAYPSGPNGKPSRSWWKFGFPVFYVTDILQTVEALAALGYARDPRLANAVQLILQKQDDQGRWPLEYDYLEKTWVDFGPKRKANKWVTLRALRALKALG